MKRVLVALLLLGCDEICQDYTTQEVRRVCYTEQERKALVEAIVACTKAGNPMSDEEGEDLVAQCQRTMTYAACPERKQHVVYNCHDSEQWSRTAP